MKPASLSGPKPLDHTFEWLKVGRLVASASVGVASVRQSWSPLLMRALGAQPGRALKSWVAPKLNESSTPTPGAVSGVKVGTGQVF